MREVDEAWADGAGKKAREKNTVKRKSRPMINKHDRRRLFQYVKSFRMDRREVSCIPTNVQAYRCFLRWVFSLSPYAFGPKCLPLARPTRPRDRRRGTPCLALRRKATASAGTPDRMSGTAATDGVGAAAAVLHHRHQGRTGRRSTPGLPPRHQPRRLPRLRISLLASLPPALGHVALPRRRRRYPLGCRPQQLARQKFLGEVEMKVDACEGYGGAVCGAGRETLSCRQIEGGGTNRGAGVVCEAEGRGTGLYVWRVEGTPLFSAVTIHLLQQ